MCTQLPRCYFSDDARVGAPEKGPNRLTLAATKYTQSLYVHNLIHKSIQKFPRCTGDPGEPRGSRPYGRTVNLLFVGWDMVSRDARCSRCRSR